MLSAMFVRSNAFRAVSGLKVSSRASSHACVGLAKTLQLRPERSRMPTNLMGGSSFFSARRNNKIPVDEEELMEERIKDAENWVTMQLSDAEVRAFNKRLGIEQEVLEAEALQAEELAKGGLKVGKNNKIDKKKDNRNYLGKLDMEPDYVEAGKLKGFLELNPFMCPGCGAPFQSKAESNPGNEDLSW